MALPAFPFGVDRAWLRPLETWMRAMIGTAPIADPGATGAIPVTQSGSVALTSAGAETRTLALPTYAGQRLDLSMNVYVGTVTMAVTGGVNTAGNTHVAFTAAGQHVELVAVTVASALLWRLVVNNGATISA